MLVNTLEDLQFSGDLEQMEGRRSSRVFTSIIGAKLWSFIIFRKFCKILLVYTLEGVQNERTRICWSQIQAICVLHFLKNLKFPKFPLIMLVYTLEDLRPFIWSRSPDKPQIFQSIY